MAEELIISNSEKKEVKYQTLVPQIESLIAGEKNLVANLANVAAAIQETFHFLWTGFYLVEENELVLGPFQGPVACTRIQYGKGVCGTSWKNNETILVPDVHQFPGHIACSSHSNSEIVVPIIQGGEVKAILDIDSSSFDHFDNTDKEYLEKIVDLVSKHVCFA